MTSAQNTTNRSRSFHTRAVTNFRDLVSRQCFSSNFFVHVVFGNY